MCGKRFIAMNVRGCHSEYYYGLCADDKHRYDSKLISIEDLDPYTLRSSEVTEDIAALPSLRYPYHVTRDSTNAFYFTSRTCSYADITVYLLHTTNIVTLEETKNYKSLQSYRYFTAGWVVQHKWKVFKETCLVIGKIKHSYAISKPPLHSWVIIKLNGTVICGHCTFMAGLGETCSHIGALLFWVEHQVKKQDSVSCTSQRNTWLQPKTPLEKPGLKTLMLLQLKKQ